jgi:L-asparaginase
MTAGEIKSRPNKAARARKVVVLATGGTIAGLASAVKARAGSAGVGARGGSRGGGPGYVAALVGVDALLDGARRPRGVGVESEQVAQLDSKDMTHAVWRALALRCRHHLARRDVSGVVITHGTDTMEETAYFLHRVLGPLRKPVLLTGAMRPADAPDADGPAHVRRALQLAAGKSSRPGRKADGATASAGVWVVWGQTVLHAAGVSKVHPTRLQAFADVSIVSRATRPHFKDLPTADTWPRVAVVYSHAGATGAVVDALIPLRGQAKVDGLVVVGTGDGSVHHALQAALERACRQGVAVRLATRCAQATSGVTGVEQGQGYKVAAHPSPVKARIDLMIELMS